jgi:hypothetical protein
LEKNGTRRSQQYQGLLEKIRCVGPETFEEVAMELFHFQRAYNPLYRKFLDALGPSFHEPSRLPEIPCLPISAFKYHAIQTLQWEPVVEFSSSGTTGSQTSRHLLRSPEGYVSNARRGFEGFYGPVSGYCVLALLPSYLERSGSSLVYMAQDFIGQSAFPQSGFFLHETEKLLETLAFCQRERIPTILLGVSFALWDLAEQHPFSFPELIVMETGGMKGRREELTREALHQILKQGFGVSHIHSEYGMTELLSQGYSQGEGIFHPAPTLRVLPRDIYDPLSPQLFGQNAALNLIDLANLDTISFIASDDLGRVYADGSFQVLGRQDFSDLRGCNLMVVEGAGR